MGTNSLDGLKERVVGVNDGADTTALGVNVLLVVGTKDGVYGALVGLKIGVCWKL